MHRDGMWNFFSQLSTVDNGELQYLSIHINMLKYIRQGDLLTHMKNIHTLPQGNNNFPKLKTVLRQLARQIAFRRTQIQYGKNAWFTAKFHSYLIHPRNVKRSLLENKNASI